MWFFLTCLLLLCWSVSPVEVVLCGFAPCSMIVGSSFVFYILLLFFRWPPAYDLRPFSFLIIPVLLPIFVMPTSIFINLPLITATPSPLLSSSKAPLGPRMFAWQGMICGIPLSSTSQSLPRSTNHCHPRRFVFTLLLLPFFFCIEDILGWLA